jgi:hypothetical protein
VRAPDFKSREAVLKVERDDLVRVALHLSCAP